MDNMVIHTLRSFTIGAMFLVASVLCIIWLRYNWKQIVRFPACCVCLLCIEETLLLSIQAIAWWLTHCGKIDIVTHISFISKLDAIERITSGICIVVVLISLFRIAFGKQYCTKNEIGPS